MKGAVSKVGTFPLVVLPALGYCSRDVIHGWFWIIGDRIIFVWHAHTCWSVWYSSSRDESSLIFSWRAHIEWFQIWSYYEGHLKGSHGISGPTLVPQMRTETDEYCRAPAMSWWDRIRLSAIYQRQQRFIILLYFAHALAVYNIYLGVVEIII